MGISLKSPLPLCLAVQIDDLTINTPTDLGIALDSKQIGQTVELKVLRGKDGGGSEPLTLKVTLESE